MGKLSDGLGWVVTTVPEYNSFTRLEIIFGLGFGLDEGDCGGED